MSKRIAARLGWSLFALSALLLAVAFVLNLNRPQYAGLGATTGELVLGPVLLLFGWFGALIVSRQPHQPIGWILSAFGGSSGPVAFANEYAIYGLITHPGAAPGAAAVAWFTTWVSAVYLGLLAALLLLFPTGQLLVLDGPEPVGVPGVLYTVGATAGLVAVLAAAVSVLVRFGRTRGIERQQIKWLLYAVLTVILGYPLLGVVRRTLGFTSEEAADAFISVLLTPVPLAMGFAILRYRLYDVDRLINRTLVYALLTALLGSVYAGAVLVLGQLFGG